jgi:hypothetical protein
MATGEVRVIEIVERESEVPDDALERRMVRRLMDQWYANQRRAARIEWQWGGDLTPGRSRSDHRR